MRSNVGLLEDFKKSKIWLDIRDELYVWLNEIHKMLENGDGSLDGRKLDRLGGNAEAIRNFLDILDVLIGLANDKEAAREAATILKKSIKGRD